MKRSRYIVKSKSADGKQYLFYNLRNGLGFKVDEKLVSTFDQLQRIEGMQNTLVKHGFLADSSEGADVLQEYMQKRATAPLHLVILPHQNCNFRCVYCYEKFDKNKMSPDVVENLIAFAEKRLQTGLHKVFSVSWFGGEPLLAPDVIEKLSLRFQEMAVRYGVTYTASLTSNGYLLDPAMVDLLLANEVRGYQITIDGVQEFHDRQRTLKGGQPSYERLIDNLVQMSERDDQFQILVRMNVGPENAEQVEQHIAEMKRLFGDDPRFMLYFHNIGRWGGPNDEQTEICSESMLVKLTNLTLDHKMKSMPVSYKVRPNTTCYAASPSSFVIGVDGMLYKCTVALYDERNHVGWLRHGGQLELNHERMNLWTEGGVTDSGCRECFFAPSCHGDSCPLIRIEEGHSPCPDTKSQIREIVTLMDRQQYPFIQLNPEPVR